MKIILNLKNYNMKKITKSNLIIALLVVNFITTISLCFISYNHSKEIANVDHHVQRITLDKALYGELDKALYGEKKD